MEVVIPPRDHGPTTYRYAWDENGEVISTQRVTGTSTTTPVSSPRGRSRQTVMWPFQSVATDSISSFPAALSGPPPPQSSSSQFPIFRRATWQARDLLQRMRVASTASSSADSALIPDYVVNYMRGETPESVARRNRNGGRIAERDVDVVDGKHGLHRTQRSQAALREYLGVGVGIGGSEKDDKYRRSVVSGTSSDVDRAMLGGDEEKLVSGRRRRPRRRRLGHGWRAGVVLSTFLLFLVLIVSVVGLVLAMIKSHVFAGETAIYTSSCKNVGALGQGLSAVISVMVVSLVAGANYVFQVLSSPTRPELTAAHGSKRWLDIGVPSLRNLSAISKSRSMLALIVVSVAVATQVIYNSVLFTANIKVDPENQELDGDQCTLALNGSLLAVVVLLHLITILATTAILFQSSFNPIVTIGDAIASFLEIPDSTTVGACLMTKADVHNNRWGLGEAKSWTSKPQSWLHSASLVRWITWATVWVILAGLTVAGLAVSITRQPSGALGSFGQIAPRSIYILPSSIPNSAAAIIASLPHILLAVLYFSTNGILTSFHLSQEFSQFALGNRLPLRVSANPGGSQTTSVILTLPRLYSSAQIIMFTGLAFALSQSARAVTVTADEGGGTSAPGIAFNEAALLVLVVLLVALGISTVCLGGFRAVPPARAAAGREAVAIGNPLALGGGSCSAAVAARCQEVPGEREGAWTREVGWGVVMEGAASVGGSGKCGFSAGRVGLMDLGRRYG